MNTARVILPYTNGEGQLDYAVFRFTSKDRIDRRKVKRAIRRWAKKALGASIHPVLLRAACRRVEYV